MIIRAVAVIAVTTATVMTKKAILTDAGAVPLPADISAGTLCHILTATPRADFMTANHHAAIADTPLKTV